MDELKMKHFLVHKWQIIRQKKQAYFAQANELHSKKIYKHLWTRLMLLKKVLNGVFSQFNEQRKIVRGYELKLGCAKSVKRAFRTYMFK